MADKESTTKVEEEQKEAMMEEGSEELLSMESLDSIIAEADPEFANSLSEIGPDDPSFGEIYNEGLSLEYTLAEEKKLWKETPGWRQKWVRFLPFLPHVSYRIKLKRATLRLSWIKWKEQFRYRLKNAVPLLLGWVKKQLSKVKEMLGDFVALLSSFSLTKKVAFLGLLVATGLSSFVIYKMTTGKVLPVDNDLFVASLEEWSQQKYFYDPKTEVESFYDSTRTAQNILLMQKMVVNLRRSPESGPTPMGAFEFYVEGAAADVVVEIKDREPEMEDLFLRTIEEMTFEQVSSGEGKQLLCERLRKELNKVLTKGYVRRIFIKTAIVKP